jgi:hypothetical protein
MDFGACRASSYIYSDLFESMELTMTTISQRQIDSDGGWSDCSKKLVRSEVAIIVGAGLSYDSGLPTWASLTNDLLIMAGVQVELARDLPVC